MANLPLMFKTSAKGWVYNFTRSPSSITRTSTTATVTLTDHGYTTGDSITIAGATQTDYNGAHTITVITSDTFTYTVANSPATPATGTITAYKELSQIVDVDYPATTVPGIVYLDGTYYVMDSTATIYGSAIENPLSWTALNSIVAETENDLGVAIVKYLNYLVAFGQWSTEFFYDAAQAAPGSPLLRSENLFLPVGCAAAGSIQHSETSVLWIAQNREKDGNAGAGRSILQLSGTASKVVSSSGISRILDGDDLASVHSYSMKISGHPFYILTLGTSNITLAYDLDMELWYQWSSLTAQSTKSITGLTQTDNVASATVTAHGYSDGDVVVVSGATQSEYNVTTNITYVDADHFTYVITGSPASQATGTPVSQGYTESYFTPIFHTATNGVDYVTDATSGYIRPMALSYNSDNGSPINFLIRTSRIDAGTSDIKKFERAELIGDKVAGNALIRCSKDDYQTYSKYRKIDLSLNRNRLSRFGAAQRASFDIRVTDNIPVRLERLDLNIDGGE